jgi:hypothetical protein
VALETGHHLPQSSSASRFTAGASGFLNLRQRSFVLPMALDTSRTQSTNVWTTGFIVRPFKVTIATGQERIGRSTGNKITEDAAPL